VPRGLCRHYTNRAPAAPPLWLISPATLSQRPDRARHAREGRRAAPAQMHSVPRTTHYTRKEPPMTQTLDPQFRHTGAADTPFPLLPWLARVARRRPPAPAAVAAAPNLPLPRRQHL